MFQSVTYTGFEKHPDRRAWVEGVVMPFVEETFRNETEPLRAYWHDPGLPSATPYQLTRIIRETVVPGLGAAPLIGALHGGNAAQLDGLTYPGIVLVVVGDRIGAGWTYLGVPDEGGDDIMWVRWCVRKLYLAMLLDTMGRRQKSYRDDPVTVGGDDADSL